MSERVYTHAVAAGVDRALANVTVYEFSARPCIAILHIGGQRLVTVERQAPAAIVGHYRIPLGLPSGVLL